MAKRNGNGDGSRPRKRPDGRYEARYWIDTQEGRKRRSVYSATRRECIDKLMDAMRVQDEPTPATPTQTSITVAEFFKQYEEVAKDTMKRRSFATYQEIARCHLLPAFADVPLEGLSRQHVQQMYSRKRDQGLSPARVKRIHGVLSSALNMAVRWRLVDRNVGKEVSPPRVPKPEVRPLSLEEAKRLLEASKEDRYHALYVLGVTTGARWAELTGLLWRDLALERREMQIQRSLTYSDGKYALEEPKTRTSRRTVTLTRKAVGALQEHREAQRAKGLNVDGDSLIFTNALGKPLHSSNFIRRSFKPTLKRAGLPDTNWHAATRHTCTCLLLLEKVNPKSVAMQMGWSSVAFMLDTYARFLPGWGDDGVMDSLLG